MSARKRLAQVVGTPEQLPSRSLSRNGTPRNGTAARSRSDLRAASRARSYISWTSALIAGLWRSARAIASSTSSTAEISPRVTRSARPSPSNSAYSRNASVQLSPSERAGVRRLAPTGGARCAATRRCPRLELLENGLRAAHLELHRRFDVDALHHAARRRSARSAGRARPCRNRRRRTRARVRA